MTIDELARKLWETHFELTDPEQWDTLVTEGQKAQYRRMASVAFALVGRHYMEQD